MTNTLHNLNWQDFLLRGYAAHTPRPSGYCSQIETQIARLYLRTIRPPALAYVLDLAGLRAYGEL